MKTKKVNYYCFKLSERFIKIVGVFIFMGIFANIVNLGIFYKGSIADLEVSLSQFGIKLAEDVSAGKQLTKSAGVDLKKESKGVKAETKSAGDENSIIPLTVCVMKEKSETRMFHADKGIKILQVISIGGDGQRTFLSYLFNRNNFIMTLILLLLLASMLPRSAPIANKYKIYLRPVFI
ncbi:MAG: hypothetical protein LBO62_03970 [Endomicrobium sp.]|jgi:hypothetical protein|nr:hypothetical protein [Endomicrobium sp.]